MSFNEHIDKHVAAVWAIKQDSIHSIADAIILCFQNGGKLFVCGNGGSAADAQHIAAELIGRYKKNRKALPCIALTTDTSILTAVANDYDYEYIFSRQLEGLLTNKDLLWVLTTSGKSLNITNAINYAIKIGATIIAFTGSNQYLNNKCHFVFNVQSNETNIIQ